MPKMLGVPVNSILCRVTFRYIHSVGDFLVWGYGVGCVVVVGVYYVQQLLLALPEVLVSLL